VDEIERELLTTRIRSMKEENKMYFESKAKELLDRRKDDNLSLTAANILFKNLNMNMEKYLSSPILTLKEEGKKTNDSCEE
jgi:hypothetical protein